MKALRYSGAVLGSLLCTATVTNAQEPLRGLEQIETVVVIYAENRGFDHLYGHFPGANGLSNVTPDMAAQHDRDGSILRELPPVWGGLTARGVVPPVTEAQTQHLANAPFAIDAAQGFNAGLDVITQSPWHLFYQNIMQINGGKNDRFVAYADKGALPMGHYITDVKNLPLWRVAREYTLADNFFMGAFGGSYLAHFWLIVPARPNIQTLIRVRRRARSQSSNPTGSASSSRTIRRARRSTVRRNSCATARSPPTSIRSTRCSRPISRAP
jgi:acid phosphatase